MSEINIKALADLILKTARDIDKAIPDATFSELLTAIEEADPMLSEGFSRTIFNLLLPYILEIAEYRNRRRSK